MKQQIPQQKKIQIGKFEVSRKLIVLLIAILVAIPVGYYLYNYSFLSPRNYAAEMAQPLGDALVKAGAVKRCERGDGGRSLNTIPWIQVHYALPQDEKTAIATVNRIAEENGYKLTRATPENRGPINVDDKFIDKWYYDHSKVSTNKDLKEGKIEMALTVNAHGDKEACSDQAIVDATHSVVSIDVKLPSVKR